MITTNKQMVDRKMSGALPLTETLLSELVDKQRARAEANGYPTPGVFYFTKCGVGFWNVLTRFFLKYPGCVIELDSIKMKNVKKLLKRFTRVLIRFEGRMIIFA